MRNTIVCNKWNNQFNKVFHFYTELDFFKQVHFSTVRKPWKRVNPLKPKPTKNLSKGGGVLRKRMSSLARLNHCCVRNAQLLFEKEPKYSKCITRIPATFTTVSVQKLHGFYYIRIKYKIRSVSLCLNLGYQNTAVSEILSCKKLFPEIS
jgi:hypothetical protein